MHVKNIKSDKIVFFSVMKIEASIKQGVPGGPFSRATKSSSSQKHKTKRIALSALGKFHETLSQFIG